MGVLRLGFLRAPTCRLRVREDAIEFTVTAPDRPDLRTARRMMRLARQCGRTVLRGDRSIDAEGSRVGTHNFQDHADAFCRERERRSADEERLNDVFLQDVCDRAASHIDTRTSVTASMTVSQFRHSQ